VTHATLILGGLARKRDRHKDWRARHVRRRGRQGLSSRRFPPLAGGTGRSHPPGVGNVPSEIATDPFNTRLWGYRQHAGLPRRRYFMSGKRPGQRLSRSTPPAPASSTWVSPIRARAALEIERRDHAFLQASLANCSRHCGEWFRAASFADTDTICSGVPRRG
jgi:hypothetical protein